MTVIAFDLPASSAVAAVNLETRTSTSGHPWTKPATGAFATGGWTVVYGDGAPDGRIKALRPSSATRQLDYLPVAMTGAVWRAHARVGAVSTFGVGLCDASGNCYVASLSSSQMKLSRVNGTTGAITSLGTPFTMTAPPYVRAVTLEYTVATKQLRGYLDGALVLGPFTDATYTPTYGAVWAETSFTQPVIADVIFEGA